MDSWSKLNETKLRNKENLYSNLKLENTSNPDYIRTKKVWNTFEMKNLGDYHDLYAIMTLYF